MKRIWLLTSTFTIALMVGSVPCLGDHVSFKTHVVTTSASSVRSISLADIDGDGDLDLMSADLGTQTVVWYENNGATSPNFTSYVIGTGRRTSSFVLGADMNGDTIMDIVSSSINDDKIAYYQNGGTGPLDFTEQVITVDPDPINDPNSVQGFADTVRMISVGDLDGDGDLDLASAGVRNDRVAWYENQGGGVWDAHPLTNSLDGARAVWVADLDDDGDQDVIGGPWFGNTMVWFENDGNSEPVFTERVLATYPNNPNPVNCEEVGDDCIDGQEDGMLWRIQTADMDGDGDTDVIAARRIRGELEWYESDGGSPPQFTRHTILGGSSGFAGKSVFPVDIDGDGHMDIVYASRANDKIAWFANDGDPNNPTFEEHILQIDPDGIGAANPEQGLVDGARSVFAGDIDGDGDEDILWAGLLGNIVGWEENLRIQLHADFDRNGDVDDIDLAQLESSYGVDAMGDTNGDGDTDGFDFLTWQRQFTGSLGAAAASTAVPEPAAWMLFLGCFALMSTKRFSRCRAARPAPRPLDSHADIRGRTY